MSLSNLLSLTIKKKQKTALKDTAERKILYTSKLTGNLHNESKQVVLLDFYYPE